jgi:hypothetical protein
LELAEAIEHELNRSLLNTQRFSSKAPASYAHAIVVRIKEQQSPSAGEPQSARFTDRSDDRPRSDLAHTMCSFWIARPPITADPTIKEKIFSLAKTAMLFADHARRLLTFSIVRK